jgi:hypothetical protein
MSAVEIGVALFCMVGCSYSSYKIGVKHGATVLYDSFYAQSNKLTGKLCLKFSDDGNVVEVE